MKLKYFHHCIHGLERAVCSVLIWASAYFHSLLLYQYRNSINIIQLADRNTYSVNHYSLFTHTNRTVCACVLCIPWEMRTCIFAIDLLFIKEFIIFFDFISPTDVPSRFYQMNPN